jgi:3-hydroxyisobutyrate dehydrogenase
MKVGFVGLGDMGAPIARRLLAAGHDLVVNDLRRSACALIVADGAEWADSPSQLMSLSEVVFACVRGPDSLANVALGEDGIIRAARADKIFVNLSTVAPRVSKSIAAELARRGVSMLDAPVSGGGNAGAQDGTLGVYVGGEADVLARVLPLLETFSAKIIHIGGIGSATTAKIIHNMVEAISRMAIAEGLTLAAKGGISPEVMIEVLKAGSFGKRRSLDSHIPTTVLTGDFDSRGGLEESLHVAYLALDLAHELKVPVQFGSLMTQETLAAVNRGWGSKNALATFLLQEERANVQLRQGNTTEAEISSG